MQFVLLFSILLIGEVDGRRLSDNIDHECKQNETIKTCTYYAEPSCTRPYMMDTTASEMIVNCNNDCQCKHEYFRNPEGECVKEEDCPYEDPKNKCKSVDCGDERKCIVHEGRPICVPKIYLCPRKNELYQECGIKDEPSCENPNRFGRTDECFSGCQCEKGFLRSSDGGCVKPKECSSAEPKCPKNELYEKCGTKNEPSCENPDPLKHKFGCAFTGCQCEKGLLRRADKKCVKPIDCDTVERECSENESFESCGSDCEPSCDNRNPTNCSRECVAGCQCNKGFLRRGDNKCVHESQCKIPGPPPTECPKNEFLDPCHEHFQHRECPKWTEDGFLYKSQSFSFCGKGCVCEEGFFRNDKGRCVKEADCVPLDCFCNTGFLRNAEGECVKEADCPYEDPEDKCKLAECPNSDICIMHKGKPVCVPRYECKENDTFRIRGSVCEPSCRTPNTYMCSFSLFKTGCHCNPGFLRNPEGECVKEEDCPYEDPENKCKSVQCGPLSICVIHEGRPLCVPQSMMLSHVVEGLFEPTSPTTKSTKNQDGQCNKNEIFKTCKTNCSETKCVGQPKTCTEECNGSGCDCQEGFFRDIFGVCINEKNCSMQRKMIDYILKFRSWA